MTNKSRLFVRNHVIGAIAALFILLPVALPTNAQVTEVPDAVRTKFSKAPAAPPKELPPLDMLVVAPHSDDEAIGCTGVMLRAIAKGERVGVIIVTQGDGFPKAAAAVAKKREEQLTPADFRQLGALRQRHTLKAMDDIGVRGVDIMFLGYPDSGLTEIYRGGEDKPFRLKFTEKSETYGEVVRDYHAAIHGKPASLRQVVRHRRPREGRSSRRAGPKRFTSPMKPTAIPTIARAFGSLATRLNRSASAASC